MIFATGNVVRLKLGIPLEAGDLLLKKGNPIEFEARWKIGQPPWFVSGLEREREGLSPQ